jgi:tRNA-dihydrouridine synthase
LEVRGAGKMKLYLAPMEGVTGYVYRNAYHRCFEAADKYFTPFISPKHHSKRNFTSKELNDILPEHNQRMYTVPQILTNRAEDFIQVAKALQEYGYEEVNLNLGCPSRTVVTKKKGAGFLADPRQLHEFLEEVFAQLDMRISVKTRLGMEDEEEFYTLMEIFNEYTMEELIIHPRIQLDYYKIPVRMNLFREAVRLSKSPLCYNGDIYSVEDYERISSEFSELPAVMCGRGVLQNPALFNQLRQPDLILEKEQLHEFHTLLYEGYQQVMDGERTVLYKMKEIWAYMIQLFEDGKKYEKQIRKAERLSVYEQAVSGLFRECPLIN